MVTLTPSSTSDEVLVAIAGDFSACDVWFSGPESWVGATENVVVCIFGLAAGSRVLLGQTALRDAQHSEDGQGNTAIWVFSVRGVPVDGFEVTSHRAGSGNQLLDGRFTLRAAAQAERAFVLGSGGLSAARPVAVPGNVVVSQAQASSLQATVVQPSATALQATVVQPSATALQATVVQSSAAALQATVVQSSAASLQATVVQSSAASLQATVVQPSATSLQATAAQGAPAVHANRWPVVLSDGTAAQGTLANPLVTSRSRDSQAAFAAAAGVISTGTAVAVKSVAYLWHPSTNAKRVEVRRIVVSFGAGAGGHVLLRALRITGVNASPGGTPFTPVAFDGADSTTLVLQTNVTNAPTRATSSDYFSVLVPGGGADRHEWISLPHGKPIVLRPSVAEGIEIVADVRAALTSAMQVSVCFEWAEV